MYHDTPSVFLKLSIFFVGFKKDLELLANMCTVKAVIQMIDRYVHTFITRIVILLHLFLNKTIDLKE